MKIVHICTQDYGGAGKAAYRLNLGLNASGVDSKMIVLGKRSGDVTVEVLPDTSQQSEFSCINPENHNSKILQAQWERWANVLGGFKNRPQGLELFSDTSAYTQLQNCREIKEADIINLHWVAGILNYDKMKSAFGDKPIIWTLHDMNAFTGGCHYADDCERYKIHCENCPQLGSVYVDDVSQKVWKLKKSVYENLNINVVTPSKWLGQCAADSALFRNRRVDVIPYGFPLNNFQAYDTSELRKSYGIDENTKLVLFGAESVTNVRKGFIYLLKALNEIVLEPGQKIKLGIFGSLPEQVNISSKFEIVKFGSINNEVDIAKIYSLADTFVIPSLEDNLPNTVIESMACGTPVVGFNIGGVPDMISHLQTGYLAKPKDIYDLANGIKTVLFNLDQKSLSENCLRNAQDNYPLKLQATRYLKHYNEILNNHNAFNGRSDLSKAEELIETGKFKEAKNILYSLLENDDESTEVLNDLAVINILENNFDKAEEYINSVLIIDSKNSVALENLSYIDQINSDEELPTGEIEFPKITIVTPSFNQAEYLEECILSVISQGYPNLEYIIMDGGSTDGSIEIIKKYEKYISYWQSKPDGGQYAAIQEGFERGTGEIFGWINSDDSLYPQGLQTVASIFMTYHDVEWITGRPSMFNEFGKEFFRINLPVWSQERYYKKDFKFIQQECTFWKKSLWEKAGAKMNVDLELAGDLELWMRFFRYAQLHTVDIFLGGFRKQPDQKTSTKLNQYVLEAEKILEEEKNRIDQSGEELKKGPAAIHLNANSVLPVIDEERLNELVEAAEEHVDNENAQSAISNLREALVHDPNSIHIIKALADLEHKVGNITNAKILLWNLITRFDAGKDVYKKLIECEVEEMRFDNATSLLVMYNYTFPECNLFAEQQSRIKEYYTIFQEFIQLYKLYEANRTNEILSVKKSFSKILHYYYSNNKSDLQDINELSLEELKELTINVIDFTDQLKMGEANKYIADFINSLDASATQTNIKKTEIPQGQVLVSAIVSTYNSEKYIQGCLEDLVNQTIYKKGLLEIVVVNSGSEQNEDAIVKQYKSAFQNINYIKTEERESIYQAWNRGIKAAKGIYVTNANTDDRHRPDSFEKMLEVFLKNESTDLIYANVLQTKIPNDTFYSTSQKSQLNWIDFNPDLLLFGCFFGPQPMWKKELHTRFGYFDESLKVVGDYEFWLRISREANIHHINEHLGLYLYADDSAEHRDNSLTSKENIFVQEKYFCQYIKNEEDFNRVLNKLNEINKVFNNQNYYTNGINFLTARKNGMAVEKQIREFSGSFGSETNGNTVPIINELINLVNDKKVFIDRSFYLGVLYGFLGSYNLMIGNLEAAEENFQTALNHDAESSEACAGLGEVFFQSGINENAKVMFEWAIKFDDQNEFAKERINKINRDNNMLNSSVNTTDSVHFQKLEQAEQFINEENYSNARMLLHEILNEDNKHVDALNDLSVIEILEGNFYRATEMISEIIDIDPRNEIAIDNLHNLEKIVDENLTSIKNNY